MEETKNRLLNSNDYDEDDDYIDLDTGNYQPLHSICNYSDDILEVEVLNNLYKVVRVKDKETGEIFEEERLIKKDCITRELLYKEDVVKIKEVLTAKGSPYKTRVQLITRGGDELVVKGTYSKYKNIIFSKKQPNKVGY